MPDRGEALAARLEQANAELSEFVANCDDESWRRTTSVTGWPVGVVASHVAGGQKLIAGWVQSLASGQPVAVDMPMVHESNKAHAEKRRDVTREDVQAGLQRNGAAAAETLRDLTDEQLDRSAPIAIFEGEEITAAELANRLLIGHILGHLKEIRETIGA